MTSEARTATCERCDHLEVEVEELALELARFREKLALVRILVAEEPEGELRDAVTDLQVTGRATIESVEQAFPSS